MCFEILRLRFFAEKLTKSKCISLEAKMPRQFLTTGMLGIGRQSPSFQMPWTEHTKLNRTSGDPSARKLQLQDSRVPRGYSTEGQTMLDDYLSFLATFISRSSFTPVTCGNTIFSTFLYVNRRITK